MSRSYKKIPGFTDHASPRSKWYKRYYNKRIRRTFDLPSGKAYRKIGNSWDICDYKSLCFSEKEFKEKWHYYHAAPYRIWIK